MKVVSNILGSGESFSCHVYSRVRSPKKEQFKTTMTEAIIAGQIKSSYNITIKHNNSEIAMIFTNSPIKKNSGEYEGLSLTKTLKFNANKAFGTQQAVPARNAERAALSPPIRAEITATPIVATICRSTIFFIKASSHLQTIILCALYVTLLMETRVYTNVLTV